MSVVEKAIWETLTPSIWTATWKQIQIVWDGLLVIQLAYLQGCKRSRVGKNSVLDVLLRKKFFNRPYEPFNAWKKDVVLAFIVIPNNILKDLFRRKRKNFVEITCKQNWWKNGFHPYGKTDNDSNWNKINSDNKSGWKLHDNNWISLQSQIDKPTIASWWNRDRLIELGIFDTF